MARGTNNVVATYSNLEQAESAIRTLADNGVPIQHVSLVAQNIGAKNEVHGFVTSSDIAKSSARVGAWVGGLFGVLSGAAFMWVPGFGPMIVIGTLASALLGGIEGAVATGAISGALGWLTSIGIDKQRILKYETSIKAGDLLVIVNGTSDEIAKATDILKNSDANEVEETECAAAV